MNLVQPDYRHVPSKSTAGSEAHERAEATEISDDIEKDINIDVNISNNTSSDIEYKSEITICYYNYEFDEKGDPRRNHTNYISQRRNTVLDVLKTPGQGALTMATYEDRIAEVLRKAAEYRASGIPDMVKLAEDIEKAVLEVHQLRFEIEIKTLQMEQTLELEKRKLALEFETKLMEVEILANSVPEPEPPPDEQEPAEEPALTSAR